MRRLHSSSEQPSSERVEEVLAAGASGSLLRRQGAQAQAGPPGGCRLEQAESQQRHMPHPASHSWRPPTWRQACTHPHPEALSPPLPPACSFPLQATHTPPTPSSAPCPPVPRSKQHAHPPPRRLQPAHLPPTPSNGHTSTPSSAAPCPPVPHSVALVQRQAAQRAQHAQMLRPHVGGGGVRQGQLLQAGCLRGGSGTGSTWLWGWCSIAGDHCPLRPCQSIPNGGSSSAARRQPGTLHAGRTTWRVWLPRARYKSYKTTWRLGKVAPAGSERRPKPTSMQHHAVQGGARARAGHVHGQGACMLPPTVAASAPTAASPTTLHRSRHSTRSSGSRRSRPAAPASLTASPPRPRLVSRDRPRSRARPSSVTWGGAGADQSTRSSIALYPCFFCYLRLEHKAGWCCSPVLRCAHITQGSPRQAGTGPSSLSSPTGTPVCGISSAGFIPPHGPTRCV